MPALNLIPTVSFEPRFRMFIINGYDRKSKRLQSLEFLFDKKVILFKKKIKNNVALFKKRIKNVALFKKRIKCIKQRGTNANKFMF